MKSMHRKWGLGVVSPWQLPKAFTASFSIGVNTAATILPEAEVLSVEKTVDDSRNNQDPQVKGTKPQVPSEGCCWGVPGWLPLTREAFSMLCFSPRPQHGSPATCLLQNFYFKNGKKSFHKIAHIPLFF
jgi:hypothetical protein